MFTQNLAEMRNKERTNEVSWFAEVFQLLPLAKFAWLSHFHRPDVEHEKYVYFESYFTDSDEIIALKIVVKSEDGYWPMYESCHWSRTYVRVRAHVLVQ